MFSGLFIQDALIHSPNKEELNRLVWRNLLPTITIQSTEVYNIMIIYLKGAWGSKAHDPSGT